MEKDLKDIEIFIDFCRAPYNFEHESDEKSYKELSDKIENLIKAYKEKEIETNNDKEMIAKLSFELGKYQEKSKEDEAVIEEMAEHIVSSAIVDDTVCSIKCDCETDILEDCTHEKMLNCTKEYFRNKAKEE